MDNIPEASSTQQAGSIFVPNVLLMGYIDVQGIALFGTQNDSHSLKELITLETLAASNSH